MNLTTRYDSCCLLLFKDIAREFNLPQHEVLESWMRSLASLRNCCAHHSRIWNRHFNAVPQMNMSLRGPWITDLNIDFNRLYAALCVVVYLLVAINRGDIFKTQFNNLLNQYTMVDVAPMGFPENWRNEPLWE